MEIAVTGRFPSPRRLSFQALDVMGVPDGYRDLPTPVRTPDGGQITQLPVYNLRLRPSASPRIWNKPLVEYKKHAEIIEIVVCRLLESRGAQGAAWAYSGESFTATRPQIDAQVAVPPDLSRLQYRIRSEHGLRSGRWDVWAWRGDHVLFAEVKRGRPRRESFKDVQLSWMHAAIQEGVPPQAFVVFEYELQSD